MQYQNGTIVNEKNRFSYIPGMVTYNVEVFTSFQEL